MADDSIVAVLPYALAIAARLDLADACASDGSTVAELADATGFDVEPLTSLMAALAGAGFFARDDRGRFTCTELGAVLGARSAVSMRATLSNVDTYRAWLRAVDAVGDGRALPAASGEAFFSDKAQTRESQQAFSTRMRERSERLYSGVAKLPVWGDAHTVLDIGGGTGTVLAAVLCAQPHLNGILFDLDPVIDLAATRSPLDQVRARCALVTGSFFEELPENADTHLLCSVLHDWDDDKAEDILRASARALPPGGRVLVCELILPETGEPDPAHWSDLGMLMLLGGRERGLSDFDKLFAAAGLMRTRVLPVGIFSLIEATPAAQAARVT
ncbi:methyltransferase [Nocardia caishijiensis]|nr:methyltransferase [Nocardia caishijiensis]